jgi:hypothetical protein
MLWMDRHTVFPATFLKSKPVADVMRGQKCRKRSHLHLVPLEIRAFLRRFYNVLDVCTVALHPKISESQV